MLCVVGTQLHHSENKYMPWMIFWQLSQLAQAKNAAKAVFCVLSIVAPPQKQVIAKGIVYCITSKWILYSSQGSHLASVWITDN